MARRAAIPLYKSRHDALVDAILSADNHNKSMATHLQVGTGARGDTICHTHSSWFIYDGDDLYYRIPGSDKCRKYEDPTTLCGDCRRAGHDDGYEPKTPAGEGRRILIPNYWTNPVTNEKEYFGLRDAVENYFALDGPNAPDGLQHGHDMLQGRASGGGISLGTLNDWIRDIATKSAIQPTLREDRLRDELHIEDPDDDSNGREREQIRDFGPNTPDLISHDLRATYCTQLMRNDVPRTKAINKTGHKKPESMEPYVRFAEGEIDSAEESGFY